MAVTGTNDVRVHTTIPPLVPGEVKGTLHVRFPILKWDCATPPPAPRLNVLLKWWGEASEGCVFRVPIEYKDKLHPSIKPSSASYNIQSNWKKFRTYLQDMGHLTLVVGLGRSADDMLTMGGCTVPHISDITPGRLEKRTCAVVTEDGTVHLGRLVVELTVEMKKVVKLKKSQRHGTTSHHRPSSSIVCSPLKGVEEDGRDDIPLNIVTLTANDKKWKPVKQVKFDSQKPKVLTEQQVEATPLPLSDKGKQLLYSIIEQAKTLHDNVIAAATDTDQGRIANKENNIVIDNQLDNESHMGVPILPLMGVVEQDVTPPISPSESMMEIATALACVADENHQKIPDHEGNSITTTNVPVIELMKEPSKPRDDQLVNLSPFKCSQNDPVYGTKAPLYTRQIPRIPVVSGDWSSKEPELFHLFLEVSEGSGFSKSSDPAALPSVYIHCRLFCLEMPIQTKIFHETKSPKINFKQIFPVYMDWNELLNRLQRGYAVIEVWDSCCHDDATATPPSSNIIKDEVNEE